MPTRAFEARVGAVKARADGRWREILLSCGVPAETLNGRNQPCPACHGTDRFQFTDKFRAGNYHCRGCGPGDGFKLLQICCGLDFFQALQRLEHAIGAQSPMPLAPAEPTSSRMKRLAKRIWEEAHCVKQGDEVDRYLRQRGLRIDSYPRCLRCHPCLGYYKKDASGGKAKKVAEYAAMLACVQGSDSHAITLHRTYLSQGTKAELPDAKKLLSAGINGAAVRLFRAWDVIAIAEGIETALAVHLASGLPVWSSLSAGNLERLWIPESVRCVHIFADNDATSHYDGQAAAFALARRLTKESSIKREVKVHVPPRPGEDWADAWRRRRPRLRLIP